MLKLSPESPLFIFLIIISFLIVTLSAWLSPQPFILKSFGLSDIIQSLSLLLFISLLLERSLEVFITTWRGSTTEQLEVSIQQQKTLISENRRFLEEQNSSPAAFEIYKFSGLPPEGMSLEQQMLQNPNINPEEPENRNIPRENFFTTINNLHERERKQIAYKADTRIIALWTSLFFGILISAVGIRSIEPLVVIDFNNSIQVSIFRCLDALLTGGLIAGGSEGIHKLIKVFTDFTEASSKQIKNQNLS